jgi:hypothetical protein
MLLKATLLHDGWYSVPMPALCAGAQARPA